VKVTVVTVCFNSAKTIGATLASVAAQTHPDVEHVLIDGASTDETLSIAREQGTHLSQIISEPDEGIYDAMNKGVAAANGDVIAFLNADDQYANPNVLADVVERMRACSLDALMGDVAFYSPGRPERVVRRYSSGRFSPERLAWGWMPAHPALFLRREVFLKTGRFRTDYKIAGDFEFVVRAFSNGQISYQHFPEILVKMQTGGASTAGLRATVLLNREVLRACRENGISTNLLKILSKYPSKLLEFLCR